MSEKNKIGAKLTVFGRNNEELSKNLLIVLQEEIA